MVGGIRTRKKIINCTLNLLIMQTQEMAEIRQDIKNLQREMEKLKSLLGDALLSNDEIDFVEETIRNIKKGNTSDFVDIDEI